MFKKLAIVFVAVFCVLLAVPTLSPKLAPFFPSWIEPVSLGLDLKGGAQLLLEVDTTTMMQEKMQQLYEETRSSLIDRNKGVMQIIRFPDSTGKSEAECERRRSYCNHWWIRLRKKCDELFDFVVASEVGQVRCWEYYLLWCCWQCSGFGGDV